MLGANTLTLSGTNTYQGATSVTAGMLEVSSTGSLPGYSSAGAVTVADGATLAVMVGGNGWTAPSLASLVSYATFAAGGLLGIDTTNATNGTFTYSTPLSAAGGQPLNLGLVKLGSNTLTLIPGTLGNNYSGTTIVSAGMLDVQSPASLPGYDVSGQVTVSAGATLAVMVGGTADWSPSGGTDNIATLLCSASFASGASLGFDTSDGSLTYSGSIADTSSGPLGLVVFGVGNNTLTLSGANTFSGATIVSAGTLVAGAADVLSSSSVITLAGGSLNLAGCNQAIAGLTGNGGVTFNGGQLTVDISGPETYSGTLTGGSGSQFIVNGSATQTLSGNSSSYTGTVQVGAGVVLDAASASALGGDSNLANVTVDSGATLAVMVGTSGNWNSGDIGDLLSSNAFQCDASLGFDTTPGNFPYSGAITDTANGPLGVAVLGDNILTLSGTNTYTGGTTVSAGTLDAQSPTALSGYNLPGQVSVATGATLAVLVGGSSSWNTAFPSLLSSVTFATGALLGFDTSDGSFTCTTAISGSNGAALNLGLVELGGNTLTLSPSSGSNNYTGATTIVAGTLTPSTAAAIPAASVVDLAGGNFDPGAALTIGGLAGTSGTVALGGNALTVQLSGNESFGGTLTGLSGSQLIVDASSSATQTISGSSGAYTGTIQIGSNAVLDAASAAP